MPEIDIGQSVALNVDELAILTGIGSRDLPGRVGHVFSWERGGSESPTLMTLVSAI